MLQDRTALRTKTKEPDPGPETLPNIYPHTTYSHYESQITVGLRKEESLCESGFRGFPLHTFIH